MATSVLRTADHHSHLFIGPTRCPREADERYLGVIGHNGADHADVATQVMYTDDRTLFHPESIDGYWSNACVLLVGYNEPPPEALE